MFLPYMYTVHMALKTVYRAYTVVKNVYRAYMASKACAGLIRRTRIEGLYCFLNAFGAHMGLQYMYIGFVWLKKRV